MTDASARHAAAHGLLARALDAPAAVSLAEVGGHAQLPDGAFLGVEALVEDQRHDRRGPFPLHVHGEIAHGHAVQEAPGAPVEPVLEQPQQSAVQGLAGDARGLVLPVGGEVGEHRHGGGVVERGCLVGEQPAYPGLVAGERRADCADAEIRRHEQDGDQEDASDAHQSNLTLPRAASSSGSWVPVVRGEAWIAWPPGSIARLLPSDAAMSALRWTLLAVALVAAMVAASLWAEPGDWMQAVQWARARRAELTAHAASCPVLAGEPTASDSAAEYERTVALTATVPDPGRERLRALREEPTAWPLTDEDRALLASLAPAVEALREAVRASGECAAPELEYILGLRVLVDAVVVLTRVPGAQAERGMHDLLTVLACGLHHAAAIDPLHQVFGLGMTEIAIDAFDDVWLAGLGSDAAGELAEALAAADRALPVASELPAVIAVRLVEFLSAEGPVRPFDLYVSTPLAAWRHGFSVRHSGMARTRELIDDVRAFEAAAIAGERWSERSMRLRALVERDREKNADLHMPFLRPAIEAEEDRRRTSAKLRLLRIVVAARAGLALPQLEDPLGDGAIQIDRQATPPCCRSGAAGLQRLLPEGH